MIRPPFVFPMIKLSEESLARLEALKQLDKDSDRALGVTCAALLDDALAECLNKHFVQANSEIRARAKMLLKPGQALSAFATRIDAGWLLGIYGQVARDDMARIRDIRNLFAHKVRYYSFDDPEIAKHCDDLKLAKTYWAQVDGIWEFHLKLEDGTPIEYSGGIAPPFLGGRRATYRYTCFLLAQLLGRIPPRAHTPLF